MTMGRLATRRFAYDAPYSWFAFAEPFAARGAHIGRDFFKSFARRTGAKLEPSMPHTGLVPAFGKLGSDSFDPRRVDPLIVDFYERTADFAMSVTGVWEPLFRRPAKLLYRPLAHLIEQLDVPDFEPGVKREMESNFGFIDAGEGAPSRIWIRTMKDDDSVFYVGAVHDSIVRTDGVTHSYITMVFPLRRSNFAVMLKLENLPNGGFRMTTAPRVRAEAGTYLVLPGETSVSWIDVPGAKEQFTFDIGRVCSRPCIEGRHEAYWLGQKAFVLIYRIVKSDDRAATSDGAVAFAPPGSRDADASQLRQGSPPLGGEFRPIGALHVGVGAVARVGGARG